METLLGHCQTILEFRSVIVRDAAVNSVVELKTHWKAMAQKATTNQMSKEAGVIGIKNLAKQLGINLTKRKVLQAIPAIGALVGASVNGWYIKE